MNYGDLLVRALRELGDDEPMDVIAALRQAHRHVQRAGDWRAQEQRIADVAYPATAVTGVTVPDVEVKRVRSVYAQRENDRLELIEPTSEGAEEAAQLQRPFRPCMTRWYQLGQAIVLTPAPVAELRLTATVYAMLPFYEDVPVGAQGQPADRPSASDGFSENVPDVLLVGAAYYLNRDQRNALGRLEMFERLVRQAWLADRRSRVGGVAEVVQPPRLDPLHGRLLATH